MATKGSSFSGGVTLLHTEQDGKHSYEVKNFISLDKGFFAREGDKILKINQENIEDVTPEMLAYMLIAGSPMLTIHQPTRPKKEECSSEEIKAFNKEPTMMNFCLKMVREEDLDKEGDQEQPLPEREWEKCVKEDNLLFISMAETSLTLVVGRGCDPAHPCYNCGRTDCQINDVVVIPERAEIAFTPIISDGSLIVNRVRERDNLFLKSYFINKYITPSNEELILKDTMSAKITIYYYMPTIPDKAGLPVVLNFTGTNNFFRCSTKKGENEKILEVVSHNRKDLKNICADDQEKWSLVFYMSASAEDLRRFESALHRGWFISTQRVNCDKVDKADKVDMRKKNESEPFKFYFVIESQK
ncbi:interleukin-1 family member A isoform X1 [Paramisgurnus dabryanus]|uniref:interleukin-1 family member A isoform X1 n=1 Tax=Paramisgurnus dabryanus TaxID=90735 RepID=UPI0031F37AC7